MPHAQSPTNVLAIVSLLASALFFWLCGLGSLVGIVCGHLGIREIDRSGGSQAGRGMALAGLILGYLGLLLMLGLVALFVFGAINYSDSGDGY